MSGGRRPLYGLGMQGLLKSPLVNVIRLLLALALVAPLLVTADPWPGTVYHFVVGKALWTRTLTAFALALWLILLLREPAYRPPKSWLLAIFGVYLLIGLLAALFGISPTRSLWSSFERMNGWVGLAHWCAYLLVLVSVFRAWRQWRALFNFGVGIGLLLGLLGLYEYFRLGPFHYVNWESTRLSITFGNPTYVGGFAAVNLFLAGALLVSSFIPEAADAAARRRAERRRQQRAAPGFRWLTAVNAWRLFWIAAILLGLTILWLSGSRGGALSVAVGLTSVGLGYAFWGLGRWRRIAAALVGPVMVLALAAFALLPTGAADLPPDEVYIEDPYGSLAERLAATARDLSIEHRVAAFRVGLRGVSDRPLLGWGPENFSVIHERYVSRRISARVETSLDRAHNKLLEEAATKGILGLLAYLGIWVWLLGALIRYAPRLSPSRRAFLLLAGGGLAAYFTHNLFLFDTAGTLPQWFVLVGFMVFVAAGPGRERERAAAEKADTAAPAAAKPAANSETRPAAIRRALGTALSALGLKGVAGIGLALVLALFATFFLNVRVYIAAHEALTVLNYAERSWSERFAAFEDSAAWFPEMANEGRRLLFNEINFRWDSLNAADRDRVLDIAARHGRPALALEPEEWRLYTWLWGIYRRTYLTGPERLVCVRDLTHPAAELAADDANKIAAQRLLAVQYTLGCARTLVNKAAELAPTNIEVQQRRAVQYTLEGDWAQGQQLIADYLAEVPAAAEHFADLQESIDKALGAGEKVEGEP